MPAGNKLKLQVQYWDIAKIKPYPRNPRKNDAAVSKMVRSIEQYGFTVPLLVKADGTIIDGHLRLKAAERLGLSSVPVIVNTHFTKAQEKAFRLMANKSVSWAKWDMDSLYRELEDLRLGDFDLTLTGFDDKFFADMDAALKLPEDALDSGSDVEGLIQSFEREREWDEDGDDFVPLTGNFGKGAQSPESPPLGEPDFGLDGITVPLSITLTAGEFADWKKYKASIEAKTDTDAFLRLFSSIRNVVK
jgi:hypothetical protein